MSTFSEYINEAKKQEKSKTNDVKVVMDVSLATSDTMEAYNTMRAFAMGLENNLPSITILKSHPTLEIAQGAAVLEKDIREIIQSILNMQIPI